MAAFVNKIILIGDVWKDPDVRIAGNGNRYASLNMYTKELWKDKVTGERKEKVEWHRIVIYNNKLVEFIEQYVNRGTKLYIEGKLQVRNWTDNTGIDRNVTEIVINNFQGTLTKLKSKKSNDELDSDMDEDATDIPFCDEDIPF